MAMRGTVHVDQAVDPTVWPAKTPMDATEKPEIPKNVGRPFGYRVVVMPVRPVEKTVGGIIIPPSAKEADEYLNYVGAIVAIGPGAFQQPKWKVLGMSGDDFPKVGDYVVFAPHSPMKINFEGNKMIVINDDEILMQIDSPVGWKAYV